MAGTSEFNGPATRPWRDVVSRIGKACWPQALVTGLKIPAWSRAAIAFAREGADVAINHLPEEAEDAREVVELMKADGRKALSIPGDIRDEAFCKRLVARSGGGPWRA